MSYYSTTDPQLNVLINNLVAQADQIENVYKGRPETIGVGDISQIRHIVDELLEALEKSLGQQSFSDRRQTRKLIQVIGQIYDICTAMIMFYSDQDYSRYSELKRSLLPQFRRVRQMVNR